MTDNEIIKALELCTNDELEVCDGCAFQKYKMGYDDGCLDNLLNAILDLINRQQAEIERLGKGITFNYEFNEEQVNTIQEQCLTMVKRNAAEIKAAAIKEFAERLKKPNRWRVEDIYYIDTLVEEMVGEE